MFSWDYRVDIGRGFLSVPIVNGILSVFCHGGEHYFNQMVLNMAESKWHSQVIL